MTRLRATGSEGRPRLLGNLAFASVSAGSAALGLALLVLAGRYLGDVDYGRFAFVLALAMIMETVMDFGLRELSTRTVARDERTSRSLLGNLFGLKLVIGGTALLVMLGCLFAIRGEAEVRLAGLLIGIATVLRSYVWSIRGVLTGLERFGLESAVVVLDRLLLLILGAGTLLAGWGLVGLAGAFLVTRFLALAIAYQLIDRQIGRPGLRFDVPYWRDLVVTALPFGSFIVVLSLYNYVDTVMLNVLRTDAETGWYSAAYRIYEGLTHIPSALGAAMMPRLSAYFQDTPLRHRRLSVLGVTAAFAVALPVIGALVVWAPSVVSILFGAEYRPAVPSLRILTVGYVFAFPISVVHVVAISSNAERLLLRTAAIGVTVNVGLNLILIPLYGGPGAAVATVAGEAITLLVLGIGLRGTWSSGPP